MDDPRLEEILYRLDAIEQSLREQRHDDPRGCSCHRPRYRGCECGARCRCGDEQRPTRAHGHCHCHDHTPRFDRDRDRTHGPDRHGREHGDFDEKRVVDLVVRLVGERVEELLRRHVPLSPPAPEAPEGDAGPGNRTYTESR